MIELMQCHTLSECLALIYAPCIYYMSEWFVERRGLANGTIDAGKWWTSLFRHLVS